MELPLVGLGLGVIAQVRIVTQSIVVRIENYCQGPETFQSLLKDLVLLTQHINEVDKVLLKFPDERLEDIYPLFKSTLENVRVKLLAADASVAQEFTNTFAGSKRNFVGQLRRVLRASSLSKKMKAVESQIKESSIQLQYVSTVLAGAFNSLALHNVLIPKINSLAIADSVKEEYRLVTSTPALPHTVHLNFRAKDVNGQFETPEGTLKHKVLSSPSSSIVTAATGIIEVAKTLVPAYGVVGMAGVGKTIALQGLSTDEEICIRFPDGIHYMKFGQGASIEDAIEEIIKIMKLTGACASVVPVRSSKSLKEAVDHAVAWFHGKTCLFLLDDLWPNHTCAIGYLNDFRQLLRCSQNSRMAISTRSVSIAIGAGFVIDFAARAPLGFVSSSIFMKYAGQDLGQGLFPSVSKILSWCGGLPISLSVTGSAVGHLVRTLGNFEHACEMYVADFEERRSCLAQEENPQGARLSDCILLSLKYLEDEFSKWKGRDAVKTKHTIIDLYTSLCVMTNQVWMPVSVLSRMWQMSENAAFDVVNLFCGLSLASVSFRKIGEAALKKAGLMLHDLQLDFCKQKARSKSMEPLWHSALLNGYLGAASDAVRFEFIINSSQKLENITPRAWWSISEDGYTHAQLARHLTFADRGSELAALLLDSRWTYMRGKIGGILGLKADFEALDELFQAVQIDDGTNNNSECIRKGFQLVAKAIQLSWGSFSDEKRSFGFQMCGRMLSLRKEDAIIDTAIKSFEAHTPKPCLLPMRGFFPDLMSAQIWEVTVDGYCGCVACSPCGGYVAAGAGHDIVIADNITGDLLKKLKGHSQDVRCIRFAATSKKVVSSSEDNTIAVWEWEKSDAPILVLEGHSDWVMGVDVSTDGNCIVSGSWDRSVRLWNAGTGLQTGEFAQSSEVICVAMRSDNNEVAIGMDNGTVKVLNTTTGENTFEDEEAHTERVTSVTFSSNGGRMATCSWDKSFRIWDSESWAAIGARGDQHTDWVTSTSFSPDGQLLVTGADDGTVRLWDVASENFAGTSSNRLILTERNVLASDWAHSVAFSCDGKRIVAGSHGGIVRNWDATFVPVEKKQSLGHSGQVLGVSISPDGLRVATGSEDKTVRLWDTKTGAQIGNALQGHTHFVTCVSFSPDGRHLVSGSWDRTLRMWDAMNFSQLGIPLHGHSDWVRSVSYSSNGLRIVSGDNGGTIRVWNSQTRAQIGNPMIGHSNEIKYVSESSDGRFVVSTDLVGRGAEGETIVWNRSTSKIAWRSKEDSSDPGNRITNFEAETIIHSCGHGTPHLWPDLHPSLTAGVHCEDNTLYSNIRGNMIRLGNLPNSSAWKYSSTAKIFAAGLDSGGVAICRLVE